MQSLGHEVWPALTEAWYDWIPLKANLYFDTPMSEVPIDPASVSMRSNNNFYMLNFTTWITSTRCAFDAVFQWPSIGPDVINWIGGPMTFLSIEGFPLPIFTDYPIDRRP